MPFYNYRCLDCLSKSQDSAGHDDDILACIFETRHGMFPDDAELEEAKRCPDCSGTNTEMIIDASNQSTFVRGHDWEEFRRDNKAALSRDMALHQLENNDPYAYMREKDDAAEMADKLKAGRTKKPKVQYFTSVPKRGTGS